MDFMPTVVRLSLTALGGAVIISVPFMTMSRPISQSCIKWRVPGEYFPCFGSKRQMNWTVSSSLGLKFAVVRETAQVESKHKSGDGDLENACYFTICGLRDFPIPEVNIFSWPHNGSHLP